MSKIKTGYTGLDIGKFLCAFLILFYHYFSEHGPIPTLIEEALSLYAVAVALFMIISGFLTFNKLRDIEGTDQRWKTVLKQVKRIFTVYLLWSIPYLIYQIATWDWANISVRFVLCEIRVWVFGSTFYTIWFMPALAIGLIIAFWITEKLPGWCAAVIGVVLYALGSMMLTYSFAGDMIPGFSQFAKFSGNWLGGARGWLFFATPLLMLGKVMVSIKDKMKWHFTMVLSIVFLGALLAEALILRRFVGHTGIDTAWMMVPTVFCILGFLISIKIPGGEYALWMRRMSVLIFMTQRIFLSCIPPLLPKSANEIIFANNYLGAVIVCGSTVVFSMLIIVLSKRFNWMKKLY